MAFFELLICALAAAASALPLSLDPYRLPVNRFTVQQNAKYLTIPKDRPFKILQFADIHYANGASTFCQDIVIDASAQGLPKGFPSQLPCSDLNSTSWEEWLLANEKPDLVIFTGDNIMGSDCYNHNDSIRAILAPLKKYGVPHMMIFGNHDDEADLIPGGIPNNRLKLLEVDMQDNLSLSLRGPADLHGVGNYAYNVLDQKGKPTHTIYLMDSSSYDVTGNVGGYDWMRPNQIDWYNQTAFNQQKKLGKTIPGILFHHIPLPEVELAWHCNKADARQGPAGLVTYTGFGSGNTTNLASRSGVGLLTIWGNCKGNGPDQCVGVKMEGVYSASVNPGMFAALLERNDVRMVNVGHDHVDNYCCPLGPSGIRLCYGGGFGYHAYGQAGWPRRSRVIQLYPNGTVTTYMRLDKWSGVIDAYDTVKPSTAYATLYHQTIV